MSRGELAGLGVMIVIRVRGPLVRVRPGADIPPAGALTAPVEGCSVLQMRKQ